MIIVFCLNVHNVRPQLTSWRSCEGSEVGVGGEWGGVQALVFLTLTRRGWWHYYASHDENGWANFVVLCLSFFVNFFYNNLVLNKSRPKKFLVSFRIQSLRPGPSCTSHNNNHGVQKFRIAATIFKCPSSNKRHTQIQLRLLEWTKNELNDTENVTELCDFLWKIMQGFSDTRKKTALSARNDESLIIQFEHWRKLNWIITFAAGFCFVSAACLLAKEKNCASKFGNPANGGSVKLLSFSLLRAHPLRLLWFPRPRRDRDCLNALCPVTEICTLTKGAVLVVH